MAFLKRLLCYGCVGIVGVIAVVVIRTVLCPIPVMLGPAKSQPQTISGSPEERLQRFASAIQIPTISYEEKALVQNETFQKFVDYVRRVFPSVHNSSWIEAEIVNRYSLLYTVKGTDPLRAPYILMAHSDVVPVDPDHWDVPPFSGKIVDGFIYGRGTIDCKHSLMGILESLETIVKEHYRPKSTFYVAFGHDEEVFGTAGARNIAEVLRKRGVKAEYLFDEGLMITDGLIPGMTQPVALVAVAEKGFLTLRLKVKGEPKHSSTPPKETVIGILSQALAKLEANPQPNLFGLGPEAAQIEHLAPHAGFIPRLIMRNLWLFGSIIARVLSNVPHQNAMVRTTTAVTRIHSGIKNNVIAGEAWAIVNHRIHPCQTVAQVLQFDRDIINDDRVEIEILESHEAHPVSEYKRDTFGYQVIKATVQQMFPNTIVAPALMIATTDTRWYLDLAKNIYRFTPTIITKNDVNRYHGNNERISVRNYEQLVNFYYNLILNSDMELDEFKVPVKDEL